MPTDSQLSFSTLMMKMATFMDKVIMHFKSLNTCDLNF